MKDKLTEELKKMRSCLMNEQYAVKKDDIRNVASWLEHGGEKEHKMFLTFLTPECKRILEQLIKKGY